MRSKDYYSYLKSYNLQLVYNKNVYCVHTCNAVIKILFLKVQLKKNITSSIYQF